MCSVLNAEIKNSYQIIEKHLVPACVFMLSSLTKCTQCYCKFEQSLALTFVSTEKGIFSNYKLNIYLCVYRERENIEIYRI